jgi:hypothetical protein
LPTPHGIGMHVEVKDPEQKVILSKVIEHFFEFEGKHMPSSLVLEDFGAFSIDKIGINDLT